MIPLFSYTAFPAIFIFDIGYVATSTLPLLKIEGKDSTTALQPSCSLVECEDPFHITIVVLFLSSTSRTNTF